MSKTEYAWVIQRGDEKFFARTEMYKFYVFCNELGNAEMCSNKEIIQNIIEKHYLQNCVPVKVKISIVGEDDGN